MMTRTPFSTQPAGIRGRTSANCGSQHAKNARRTTLAAFCMTSQSTDSVIMASSVCQRVRRVVTCPTIIHYTLYYNMHVNM